VADTGHDADLVGVQQVAVERVREVGAEDDRLRAAHLRLDGDHGGHELLAPVHVGGGRRGCQPARGGELPAAVDELQRLAVLHGERPVFLSWIQEQ